MSDNPQQPPSGRPDFGRPDQWSNEPPQTAPAPQYGQPQYGQPQYGQSGQPQYGQGQQGGYQVPPTPGQVPVDPYANWAPPTTPPSQSMPQPAPQRTQAIRLRRGQPVVTYGIIGACVLVWLAQMGSLGFSQHIMLTPALGYYEPWRMLTSAFAHSTGSFMHIMFNMYALWALGQSLELALGRARYSALYLLSALGGSIGFMAAAALAGNWQTAVVGASGAVFGLFGALLPIQRQIGASSQQLYLVLALNFAIGFMVPGIAWQAHLGGFVTGLACGWLMMRAVNEARAGKRDRTWAYLGAVFGVLALVYGVVYVVSGLS